MVSQTSFEILFNFRDFIVVEIVANKINIPALLYRKIYLYHSHNARPQTKRKTLHNIFSTFFYFLLCFSFNRFSVSIDCSVWKMGIHTHAHTNTQFLFSVSGTNIFLILFKSFNVAQLIVFLYIYVKNKTLGNNRSTKISH